VPELPRRFYREAEAVEEEGAFRLRLDGKPARTPARNPLAVPSRRLAAALEEEWSRQAERIDPATMPVTRLANSAIDGVAPRMEAVRADVVGYAGSDLLCYRAGEPEGLAERQARHWDPVLAWAERRLGVRFVLAEGLMHVPQPAETLDAFAAALARLDEPFALAGLHVATTLTGSALLALALAEGEIGVAEAWQAAHVDEDWNMQLWGEDAEALNRRAARLEEFRAAALALGH
jgi:chaperone required for assembly of F1-ATPase